MDRSRTASDKVRPFLEAMERRIDQVRAKRTGQTSEPPSSAPVITDLASPTPAPVVSAPSPTPGYAESNHRPNHTPNHGHDPSVILEDDESKPVRLKARPKRSSSFGSDNPPQSSFSQAG